MSNYSTDTALSRRSCEECSRLKCKCVAQAAGGPCTRCLRLKRECRPTASKRKSIVADNISRLHRNGQHAESGASARLEAKLDALAASLHAGGSATTASTPDDHKLLGVNTTHAFEDTGVTAMEAEDFLNTFRDYHLRYFPFVHIPAEMTAAELHIQRPYLLYAILTTGSYSVRRQQHIGDLFRRAVAEAMVIRSEKSIDLLLGLLTFIGW